ncbi:MAG: ATP-binding protein [Oscillospiraceae bacterium]|nr:ATP-binding protein [Oscillospiraceae bacterium]MCL2279470.1 ATP-binding protein [Oscillospiraceae bacterium]
MIYFINKYIFGGANKTIAAPYILFALLAYTIGTTVYYVLLFDGHYLFVRSMMNIALLISFITLERSSLKKEVSSFLSPVVMMSIMAFGFVYFDGDFLVYTFAFAGALFSLSYMNPKGLAIYIIFVSVLQGFFLFVLNQNIMGASFTMGQNYAGFIITLGLNIVIYVFCKKFIKLSRAKEMFLSNMSHEMRTPLNAILGFSELSLETENLSEYLHSNLFNIRAAGMTLLSLISDLLDISKIETGMFSLIPGEYNTAAMISAATTQNILHRGDKPIKFNITIDDNFPAKLFGDELKIRQVLNNLLSNAFKYTEKGTVDLSISSTIEHDSAWVTVEVSDTGRGVRDEELMSIFDDFVQVDISTSRNIMGTGLGLSIARRLVRMMDGDIVVASEYGEGSVFTARFRQQVVSDDVISPEVIDSLKNLRYSEQRRIMTENMPLLSLPYAHVLVVDDVPTNLMVAASLLKRYNISVYCVSSGPDAIEVVKKATVRFNAIFMDHLMPDMDGIEATRLIREIDSDYARTVPIIAFTADAIAGNEKMFLSSDFQGFITKPVDLSHLDTIVRDWIWDESKENDEAASDIKDEPPANIEKPAQVSLPDFHVEGIDFHSGLERYGGDVGIYFTVMRSFAKNIPQVLEKTEAVTETDLLNYTTAVHGIKSSCYSICADDTAALAEALEIAGKAEDFDFIVSHNAAFAENVRSLLSDIDKIITKIQSQTAKRKDQKAAPDSLLFSRLADACNNRNVNEIEEIIKELDSFVYESGGDLVHWIKEMADEMNYSEIAERLENLSE